MMYDSPVSDSRGSRKRSRSPRDYRRSSGPEQYRSRSSQHSHHRSRRRHDVQPKELPYNAKPLSKHDFQRHCYLFAEYLDIQKRLHLPDLDENEVKGRWKSFLGKWNRGELAEGWYEPGRAEKAAARMSGEMATPASASRYASASQLQPHTSTYDLKPEEHVSSKRMLDNSEEDEDDIGPDLPQGSSAIVGPAIPSLQDLQHRGELVDEDREARLADLRHERRLDRKAQKERMEDLVPRAEPGTRERQLEKKREAAASNRAFATAKEVDDVEVGDKDLMGGDDGVDEYKRKLKLREKAKTEREIRKEEVLRARAAEREEKLRGLRDKEEKTMAGLRELAKARFG